MISRCNRCDLSKSRTRIINGDGDRGAKLALVGEAPGAREDAEGRPFVGRAGKFLDDTLASLDINRESVFITNVVKCRPPNNRRPKAQEIAACRPHLMSELLDVRPKVAVTLGSVAVEALIGKRGRLGDIVGKEVSIESEGLRLTVIPNYHPAAAMRNRTMRAEFRRALARAARLVR